MEQIETKKIKVAIQGGYGAFHEIAARHYFTDSEIEIVPRSTFKDLFSSIKKRQAHYGIMAIENSLAGSILPNYTLIRESKKKIIGELYLRINQNLVALPGQSIEDIDEVYSHPMAILQCQVFFDQYSHVRLIDSIDTALSAKEISEKQLTGVGAIASKLAADKYGLEVISENIETDKLNYTRFLIVSDKEELVNGFKVNKSSLHFTLGHKIGSLSKILTLFSFYDMNLSKIQSMPIVGKGWEYQFFVDLEFDDYDLYRKSLEAIEPFTGELGVLGEYKKGRQIL